MKYKMMNAEEIVDLLYELPLNTTLYFTFDDCEEFEEGDEAEGWYGVKFTTIFDEFDAVFAFGYMGGGCTEAYDIYANVEDSDDKESIKKFCAKKLQYFLNQEQDTTYACERVCVEIGEVE